MSKHAVFIQDRKQREQFKASEDPLEAFMKTVKSGGALDSMTRSKMHRRKAELSKVCYRCSESFTTVIKDLAHWKRLATAAAPAALPDILKPTSLSGPRKGMSLMKGRVKSSGSVMAKPVMPPPKKPSILTNQGKDDVVENDSDEEEKAKDPIEKENVESDRKTIKLFDVASEKPTPKTTTQSDSTAKKVQEVPKSNQKRKIAGGTLSGITKTKFNAEYAVSGRASQITKFLHFPICINKTTTLIPEKVIRIPSS